MRAAGALGTAFHAPTQARAPAAIGVAAQAACAPRLRTCPSAYAPCRRRRAPRGTTPPRASRRACSSPASMATRPSHPGERVSTSASIALARAASTTSAGAETSRCRASPCVVPSTSFPPRSAAVGADVCSCSILVSSTSRRTRARSIARLVIEVTGPARSMTRPVIEITGPAIEITGPARSITSPAIEITGPAIEITGPARSITSPAIEITGPARSITSPAIEITGPAGSITSPAIEITGPARSITSPAIEITGPARSIARPAIEIARPAGVPARVQAWLQGSDWTTETPVRGPRSLVHPAATG